METFDFPDSILDLAGTITLKELLDAPFAQPWIISALANAAHFSRQEEDIVEAALNIVEMGVEVAVISRGNDGIIAATKASIIKAVAPPVKVRSAIGAGDCTVAGLALKLAYREPFLEACRLAVAMGTAAVLTPGTELCRKADVEKLLPQVKVWDVPVGQRAKAFSAPGS